MGWIISTGYINHILFTKIKFFNSAIIGLYY